MLELDHVICCVPDQGAFDPTGFTLEPGQVHAGQGTRNVRVMFDRNYLEVLWIDDAEALARSGLDFAARCVRPARAVPFGCVLRGAIPAELRARFVPYPLPGAPGVVLMRLADQSAEAPFVAVFEVDESEARWPARRFAPDYLVHPGGATRILRATFTCPAPLALGELADVQFAPGPARLDLALGDAALAVVA